MIGTVSHCDWRALADRVRSEVGQVDTLIVDAPYSDLTHDGQPDAGDDGTHRRPLAYASWSPDDVAEFVAGWAPLVRGWMVSITDSELAGPWRRAMRDAGRLTFQPLPLVERGMTVRKTGDGPSSWATWAVVARPRGPEWVRWGTLDGAYVGNQDAKAVVGGKPLWMMLDLVRDYTRPGDLVCDPCCGAGTTLAAAEILKRRWIGGDVSEAHAALARERLAKGRARLLAEDAMPTDSPKALALFGDRT